MTVERPSTDPITGPATQEELSGWVDSAADRAMLVLLAILSEEVDAGSGQNMGKCTRRIITCGFSKMRTPLPKSQSPTQIGMTDCPNQWFSTYPTHLLTLPFVERVIEVVELEVAEASTTPILDILAACDWRAKTCGATVVLLQRLMTLIMTTSSCVDVSVRPVSML
ncbi:hypothetical protein WAI453_010321 [Rhynchosporium graminicola]